MPRDVMHDLLTSVYEGIDRDRDRELFRPLCSLTKQAEENSGQTEED